MNFRRCKNTGDDDIPGSAITTSRGLPPGDHLSAQKNCFPVRERRRGPKVFTMDENMF